jgi:hypothetical protein
MFTRTPSLGPVYFHAAGAQSAYPRHSRRRRHVPRHSDLNKQRNKALSVVHASNGYDALCASFDPYSFSQPDYAPNVIAV